LGRRNILPAALFMALKTNDFWLNRFGRGLSSPLGRWGEADLRSKSGEGGAALRETLKPETEPTSAAVPTQANLIHALKLTYLVQCRRRLANPRSGYIG